MTSSERDIPDAAQINDDPLARLAEAAADVEYETRLVDVEPIDRFVAKGVDVLIAGVAYAVIGFIFFTVIEARRYRDVELLGSAIWAVAVLLQMCITSMNLWAHGSPGKRFAGMTITRPRGEPASAGRLAARALIAHGLWILFTWSLMLIVALEPRGMQMVPPLLLAGAFLQAIVSTILVCATRRALHDFLTDTTVATWQTRALRPGRRAFDVVLSGDASQPRS